MASSKSVRFAPNIPSPAPAKPKRELPADFDENFLEERPTILRIKRSRDERIVAAIVLEAEQPNRKKRRMQELTEALKGMKVAEELHEQFKAHLKQQSESKTSSSTSVDTSSTSKPALPESTWSAPSKSLESSMRKIFRLIGTDDASLPDGKRISALVSDLQSGRAQRKDIVKSMKSSKSYESSKQARVDEAKAHLESQRSYHLRRVSNVLEPSQLDDKTNNLTDEEEDLCKVLELVSKTKELPRPSPAQHSDPSIGARVVPGGLKLPVVLSSRQVKENAEKKAAAAMGESEFVTSYYILEDGEDSFSDITDYQNIHVPLAEFRQELLEDFVLEGEYSDSDRDADSDDSQNRSEEWEYGSDPEDDDAGSSEEEEQAEEDEIMDEMGEFHHTQFRYRGYGPDSGGPGAYDLEIDPNEQLLSDDENDGVTFDDFE